MEVNRLKQLQRLRSSIPDMQKTLDTVKFLESKQVSIPVPGRRVDDRILKKSWRRDLNLMIHCMRLHRFLLQTQYISGLV